MILVRFKNDVEPSIVFSGTENEVIGKIHELNLTDFHDAFFYEREKFENLGYNDENVWDYYAMYESEAEFHHSMSEVAKDLKISISESDLKDLLKQTWDAGVRIEREGVFSDDADGFITDFEDFWVIQQHKY